MSDDITRTLVREIRFLKQRVARLEGSEYVAQAGSLRCPRGDEKTLDSDGAISVDSSDFWILVDTYEDAASDDLVTIDGGTDGQILIIQTTNSVRDVVVKDEGDNIKCGGDITLGDSTDRMVLLCLDGSTWYRLCNADN